ncbi:MAG TPA: phage major capsid protein [Methanocorpusculum sp.]|nr:phage major capsid protein [Methanocorpusculum sp.]
MTATYNATEELAKTLKVLCAPNKSQRNALIDKYFTGRNLPVMTDEGVKQKHDLLRSETLDGAALLLPDLVRTINKGAQPALASLGDMYTVLNTTSNQVKIPRGNKNSFGSYAPIVAEGASTAVNNDRILYSMIDIIKTRTIAEITREMMRDSEIDIVAYEVEAAGARAANTIQSVALYEMQNNAAATSSETVTSAKTLKEAINAEIANIQKKGYVPDRIMLTPKAGAWLRDELTPGYYDGNDPMKLGAVPTLYGIKCVVNPIAPATYSSPDYTPGNGTFGGTNGIGAIVYAKDKAVAVAMREQIGLDGDFRDVYKDLEAMAVSARFGAGPIHKYDSTNADEAAAVYISY